MKYEILNESGDVINTILASESFVQENYPGSYRLANDDYQNSVKAAEIRQERNNLLSNSDWTQLADSPVNKVAWSSYRQALRNIPAQSGFPWEVTWPQQPK